MPTSKVPSLYDKNNSSRQNCNNCRGISFLLNRASKIPSRVLLHAAYATLVYQFSEEISGPLQRIWNCSFQAQVNRSEALSKHFYLTSEQVPLQRHLRWKKFYFLGSLVTNANCFDVEVKASLERAVSGSGTITTFHLVLLRHCSETWSTYRRLQHRLNGFSTFVVFCDNFLVMS